MPRKSADNTEWVGAAPVSKDGFAFGNGIFFADVSGSHRHPRASAADLRTHFNSSTAKNQPTHWYEAQLAHYGLQRSKTRSVARMRLLDATNSKQLVVPTHLVQLERQLKKDWEKLDKAEKQKAKGKRKADEPAAGSTSARASKVAKVAKVDKAGVSEAPSRATARGTDSRGRGTTAKTRSRAGRGGIHQGPGRSSASQAKPSDTETTSQPRRKNTARRSKPFLSRPLDQGRSPAPSSYGGGYRADGPSNNSEYTSLSPDPKDDEDDEYVTKHEAYDDDDDEYDHDSPGSFAPKAELETLGLLNGAYGIDSAYVSQEWPGLGSNLSLMFTLAGREMWGGFDLGVIEGVLHFAERPWDSSHDPIPFKWRGRENEGPIIYGDENRGWITFLGGGRIEGRFDYMDITFSGQRGPGQGTRSCVDAKTLKEEWRSYSEDRYEEDNRARWR